MRPGVVVKRLAFRGQALGLEPLAWAVAVAHDVRDERGGVEA